MFKDNRLFKYIYICFLIVFLVSCGSGFDPRLYNSRGILGDDDSGVNPPPPPPIIDADQDPFLFPENNNPDAGGFNGSKFDEWTLYTYFDNKNVARHVFRNYKQWVAGDMATGEYKLSGEETHTEVIGGDLGKITDVTYLMYKGKNDHFAHDSPYNIEPVNTVVRMERFRFFRFKGEPFSGPKLDNRLMAIDTMTKLIFAYSKPTEFKEIVGQQVPTKWEPVDVVTKVSGLSYPFYEFDPIGIVNADGSVELFDQYVTDTENGYYDPRIDIVNPDRQIASAGKPGRSPYMVVNRDLKLYELSIKAKSLKNIGIRSKKYNGWTTKYDEVNEAYITYAIRSSVYLNGDTEFSYDILSHKNKGEKPDKVIEGTIRPVKTKNVTDKVIIDGVKDFADPFKEYVLVGTELEKYALELDSIIIKYSDSFLGNLHTSAYNDPNHTKTYNNPSIKFIYDKTQEAFVLDTVNSNLDKTTVDTDFTLRAGEGPKDFVVNYNNESEITYIVEFKEKLAPASRRY